MNLGAIARSELQSYCRLSAGEMAACRDGRRGMIIRASLLSVLEYHDCLDRRGLWSRIGCYLFRWNQYLEDRAMTLERLIEEARTRNNTHAESLRAARERMVNTNKRLASHFTAQEVTPALLAKTCSL